MVLNSGKGSRVVIHNHQMSLSSITKIRKKSDISYILPYIYIYEYVNMYILSLPKSNIPPSYSPPFSHPHPILFPYVKKRRQNTNCLINLIYNYKKKPLSLKLRGYNHLSIFMTAQAENQFIIHIPIFIERSVFLLQRLIFLLSLNLELLLLGKMIPGLLMVVELLVLLL